MIKVTNDVPIYEEKGDKGVYGRKKLVVMSHWSDHDKVILLYEDVEIAVIGKDLLAAIANAQNTRRF